MLETDVAAAKSRIKAAIERHAYVRGEDSPFLSGNGQYKTSGWIFDMRNILLRSEVLDDIAAVFWDTYRGRDIQIGTIETAGIPLVTALIAHSEKYAGKHCTGFYIRKSRKKTGLLKMIEGTFDSEKDTVLVDDVINSGRSFARQVEAIEASGGCVADIWMFIRYRDPGYYSYFYDRHISIVPLFELNDFRDTLGVQNLEPRPTDPPRQDFDIMWKFAAGNPSYHHVVPKSDPVADDERVYFGTDNGIFWAIHQNDGSVAWQYKVGFHPKGKGIFSSPAIHDGTVYFGAYDGNVYALDAKTGKRKWVALEADWVGSSPALAPELGLLFIGLEFGLWRKRGGIIALDMHTGTRVWDFTMPCYTHSSPLYIAEHRQVVIGSNDGAAYLFDAQTGTLAMKLETGDLNEHEMNVGFSRFDIKESFAYDAKRDMIVFGNRAGVLHFVQRPTGKSCHVFQAEFGFYSTPLIIGDTAIATSLDKHAYCIDLDTFELTWKWHAGARIFSSPTLIDGLVYVGANSGKLVGLEPYAGREVRTQLFSERITNRPAKGADGQLFVLTFANELYCIRLHNS